ncbi:hypothetical protein KA047_03570, partial [Candidatus Saccharibacteria bacterium]|nr:hypothetical protein [Candidatus Saccharibacteria bacterium]
MKRLRARVESRRFLASVATLTYLLVVVIAPATSVRAFGDGNGSEGNPYIITTCEELQDMADDLDAYYRLGGDIDCSDTSSWNSGKGFDPIGDNVTPFTGRLDGSSYSISDLTILRANDVPSDSAPNDVLAEGDEEYVGLFGYISNANVSDVHVRTSKIKGFAYVGGIAGYMNGGSITNSSVNASTANNSCDPGDCVWARYGYYGGGIVGHLEAGTISDVTTAGPVKGSGFHIGGLVGNMAGGSVLDASTASWTDGGNAIGGAVGSMFGGSVARVSSSGRAYAALDESAG